MFRIEVFVEDKRLADALRALAGIARGQPSVMPVTNVVEGGTGAPQAATNGKLLAMFEAHLTKVKTESISPADIREWLNSIGRNSTAASAASYVANQAIDQHLLRRVGKSSAVRYIIIKPKKG